jgi:ribosomal protein L40E
MTKSEEKRFCLDCGTSLGQELQKCPKCGSGNKRIEIEDVLYASTQLRGKVKNPEVSGNIEEFRIKRRIAGESGNLARDELIINRRNRKVTIKYHKVEELIDGQWQVVHEHSNEYKAKNR